MKLQEIDEAQVTRSIIQSAMEELLSLVEVDVAVVVVGGGGDPSGLVAGRYLAKEGLSTLILERRLSFGGGMGGGGMLLPKVLVQTPADKILREINVKLHELEEELYIVDTAEMIAKLASLAIDAGAKIILGITVEDLVYRGDRVAGVVTQWTAVQMSGLHVDPLAFKAKAVVDCTGHEAEVLKVASRKIPELKITVPGEKSMWTSMAERSTVEKTGEVAPGLFAAGMVVAALHQTPRMGPIFSGTLLSGKKVAELIAQRIERTVNPRFKS